MFVRLFAAVFAPKHPKFYAGRHRARIWFRAATNEHPAGSAAAHG